MTRTANLAVGLTCLFAGAALGQPSGHSAPAPSPGAAILGEAWTEPAIRLTEPPQSGGPRIWASADYLLGWVRGDPLPPLVTTSPADTPRTAAGVLGQSGTTTLFGSTSVNRDARSGARAEIGFGDRDGQFAFEVGFFILSSADTVFSASSTGDPILARPFTDVTTANPASALVAFPGLSSGSIVVDDSARILYGGNFDFRQKWLASSWCRVDGLVGYRFLCYDERLVVNQSITPTSGAFTAGTTVQSIDSFTTRNLFNGVDMGLHTEIYWGSWSLDLLTKIAVGGLKRTVTIAGSQQVDVPGSTPTTSPGGLLALSSNIGAHSGDSWDVVPELGAMLCWDVTEHIRLRGGYTVLWLPLAARAGQQLDLGVNPGLIPPATASTTPSRPAVTGTTSTLWMQNVSFGMEVRF